MTTSRGDPLLVVENLSAPPFGSSPPLWAGVSFTVKPSTILCLRGPSGSGKSVLLKCLAHLLVYPTGTIHLSGQSPADLGVPVWRSKVLYLPQRPALLPGTPNEFWETLKGFKSRKGREDLGDPWKIAAEWGIARPQWDQTWGSLSGGEGQRIALAVALALKPTVLLLDEPTSALDSNAAALVEDTLMRTSLEGRQTCVWVTHSDEQAARVATETFDLTAHLQAEV